MQVQARYPPALQTHTSHEHQHQIHVNATRADSRPDYSSSTSTTSPTRAGDMQPYHQYQYQQQQQQQQQYAAIPGPAPPLAQHRHYAPNPPLPSMMAPPVASMPGPMLPAAMFNSAAQLPLPLAPPIQQLPPEPPRKALSTTGNNGKYSFTLVVDQQPARARMCGFGDKDRRPITPPPCIKLVITDMAGKTVSPDEIDGSFFTLSVDLWDDTATREVNIVRSNSSSPSTSISNASLTSYPPTAERPQISPADYGGVYYTPDGRAVPVFAQAPPQYGSHPGMPPYGTPYYSHLPPVAAAGSVPPHYPAYATGRTQESSNLHTRNLIGSLVVNASVLKDPSGTENYWFVMQDLSVRTEGFFRLKMTFLDVGNQNGEGVNKGQSRFLATVYSDSFQVYSAKKFPGVIESTPLSKCFASQGIKIPIRKDVKTEQLDDQGGDDYED